MVEREHLFIYYRVDADALGRVEAPLREIQATLERRFGCRARLMRKRGEPTMMEIYEDVACAEALLRELDERLAATGFARWLAPQASRHVERFIACA